MLDALPLPASAPGRAAPGLDQLVRFFEEMTPSHLEWLGDIYSEDASFKDPFNEVQGLPAIRGIFAHMFATLREPRFRVTGTIAEGMQAMVVWEFHCLMRRGSRPLRLRGASHLTFGADGRVQSHRDYWDTAEELYMKVPLLGSLMRALRRLLAAPNSC